MYKWELHLHTAEGSRCGKFAAEDAIKLHKEHGFSGLVVTDHYLPAQLQSIPGTKEEQLKAWLRGYENARAAGEKLGVTVLFGLELRFVGSANDLLIYGTEPDFIWQNPDLYDLTLPEVHALCQQAGALLIQAHPNRRTCCPEDETYLDGVEIYNGSPRQVNQNELTAAFAAEHPELIYTAGSDFHQLVDLAGGVMYTQEVIRTPQELARALREGKFYRK